MEVQKLLFFILFLFFSKLSSFVFFPVQKNFDLFWHLKILNLEKLSDHIQNPGKGVKVAILDTHFHETSEMIDFYQQKKFNSEYFLKGVAKMQNFERFCICDQTQGGVKNFSPNLKKLSDFSEKQLKKNHGASVASLIRQIAPYVEIISVPIFNDDGLCSKQTLIQALQKLQQELVDIVCLSLHIDDFDNTNDLQNQQIKNLLKTFTYVVMAEKNSEFIQKNTYQICSVNFLKFMMPGKDLAVFMWLKLTQNFVITKVSGSSMATACMAGCLAIILSSCNKSFLPSQVEHLLQKHTILGSINLAECILQIHELKIFQSKMNKKKFIKKFKKLVKKTA